MTAIPVTVKHALRGPFWIGDEEHEGPVTAGLLHGDHVDPASLAVVRRAAKGLVGIVDFLSRTRYGVSSRGVPQYLFHPLDTRYPPMIVGSKAATTANQWAIVNFDTWTIPKDKWPRGALQELLGPTGDLRVEQAALRRQVLRGYPTKRDCVGAADTPPLRPDASCENSCEAAALGPLESWDTVLNVDPDGCRDVDDIVGWRRDMDGTLEVFIGIANVAAHVPLGSPLDVEARRRGQTVYEDGVVLAPMLPPHLSEDRCSLRADGVARSVVAAIWRFDASSSVRSNVTWRVFRVVNQQTYTYESILSEPGVSQQLQTYLSMIVLPQWLPAVESGDPHVWIEAAMVTYNALAAERLSSRAEALLRVHSASPAAQDAETWRRLAERTECKELAFLGMSAGAYVAAEAAGGLGHAGLGLPLYCHASSPLRRYADLVNQRALLLEKDTEKTTEDTKALALALNVRAKEIKRFERDLWCSQHMLADHPIGPRAAIVLGWKRDAAEARLKVYVPAWRRCIHLRVLCDADEEPEHLTLVRLLPEGQKGMWTVSVGAYIHVRGFLDVQNADVEHRYVFEVYW